MLSVSHRPAHTHTHTHKFGGRIANTPKVAKGPLTGVQQQLHHGEVRMGHAVVERHVPVAVRQVHHVRQQSGRGQAHLSQVGSDGVGLGVLLAGHPEPLLVEGDQDLSLWRRDGDVTARAELVSGFYPSRNIVAIVSLNSSHLNNRSCFNATLLHPLKPKEAAGGIWKINHFESLRDRNSSWSCAESRLPSIIWRRIYKTRILTISLSGDETSSIRSFT